MPLQLPSQPNKQGMSMSPEESEDIPAPERDAVGNTFDRPKKEALLSFRCVNRVMTENGVKAEFTLMRSIFDEKPPTPADFHRVGIGSGSHLLKLTTPRADSKQAVLRFARSRSNVLPFFAPSVNAPDIPYAKIVYRPLEIRGHQPKSVVDHIRDPDEISELVLSAFASVFGRECLDSLKSTLLGEGKKITSLPDTGEFPTIFLPCPGGGDIQATPVSPVETFMGFKYMSKAWSFKPSEDGPSRPRGRWIEQSISGKPQNISGMIGGSRKRFLAEMPSVLRDYEAGIRRYAFGGSFPAWRHHGVEASVLQYAGRLNMEYTNSDIRAGTDWYADQLIQSALDFIADVQADARNLLEEEGNADKTLPRSPAPSSLILRRRWGKNKRDEALKALTSEHFRHRERIALEKLES
jgi:hypothetical protein